jgi:hypothetical protein
VVAAAAAAGLVGGVALAASGTGSQPSFVDALARHLGISTEKLQDAAKAAALDQVDAALAAGRITKAQADAAKARIDAGVYPLSGNRFGSRGLGPAPGFGFGPGPVPGVHFFGFLAASADYLGLSEQELLQKLGSGQSLAQIAEAQGKSVDGLRKALTAAVKARLDKAVAAKRITADREQAILDSLQDVLDRVVNATAPLRSLRGAPFGRAAPFFWRHGSPVRPWLGRHAGAPHI